MINNFEYSNPVEIIFGAGSIANIADKIPLNARVLVTYGGGSIKHNGVYDQVKRALVKHTWFEFSGIEANPVYETLLKAIELVKEEKIDFLLAVGGGSVLDGTKFIAAGAKYKGDNLWDICRKRVVLKSAIPIGTIITLPATGSEMNCGAVVSNKATQEKLAFLDPVVYPKFSILDPFTTFTLPTRQIVNGIIDTFIHITEQYLNKSINANLQDRQSETILNVLVDISPKLLAEQPDYDSRADFMWTATSALNGTVSCGVPSDWGVHEIGHEFTAFYGLDHGQTLAIILPALLKYQFATKKEKLTQMFMRVWNGRTIGDKSYTAGNDNADELANKSIAAIEDFFHSIGGKTKFADYGIKPDYAKLEERLQDRCPMGEDESIAVEDALAIIKLAE